MIIVVEMILDATVALVDLTAGLHGALVRGLSGPQIVTERLYVKVKAHCAKGHCWDRCCSSLHLKHRVKCKRWTMGGSKAGITVLILSI